MDRLRESECDILRNFIAQCVGRNYVINKNSFITHCSVYVLPVPEECYTVLRAEKGCCRDLDEFLEECLEKEKEEGTFLNCVIKGGYYCEEDEDGIFRFKTKRDCMPYIGK